MTNEKKSTPCSARGQFVPLWAVFSGKNGKTDRQGCVERKNEEISAVPWRSKERAAPKRRRPRPSCRRAVVPSCPSCPSYRRARRARRAVAPFYRCVVAPVVPSRPSERASGRGCFRNDGAGESGKKNKEKTAAGSQGFRLRFANRKNTLSGKTRRIPAENRAKRGAEDSGGKPGESYPFFLLQIVWMRIPES